VEIVIGFKWVDGGFHFIDLVLDWFGHGQGYDLAFFGGFWIF
jgi:hypothetical protein